MKKGLTLILLILFTKLNNINAQEEVTKQIDRFKLKAALNTDVFFGFNPSFAGSYKLKEKLDFTFYGIMWAGGTGQAWGNWTEFGVGFTFPISEGISVNPQIGLLNGSLTSGLGTPILGEGFVPNLTITLDKNKTEGEFYLGYYTGIDHGNTNTNNYLHYWLNYGYKFSGFFSSGIHYEHLRFTGGKNHSNDAAYDYYQAVGPYVQFSDPNGGSFTRFSTGLDIRSNEQVTKSNWKQPSFFKLTLGYNF
jgi:hypothetical protein